MTHNRDGPGQKPVIDFKTLQIPPLDTEPEQLDTITYPYQEGLQDDKADPNYPQIIPEYILPAHHRPQHHTLKMNGYN